MKHPIQPVILCGGTGSRLWPLSRETFPKQFHRLGQAAHTMLQETALRLNGLDADLPIHPRPIAVANVAHRFIVAQQLQEVCTQPPRVVLEPVGRNTAPALTLAALQAEPGDVLLVMPADHVIQHLPALHAAIAIAWADACQGAMVTFGIRADRPETGYGYIEMGTATASGSHELVSFAEKPDATTAQAYLDGGRHVWNSGMFMVRAEAWLRALRHCRPDMLQACSDALAQGQADTDFIRPDTDTFEACPADSIDYAVMEHLGNNPAWGIPPRVVPLDAGWSDLGAWSAVGELYDTDEAGNALVGITRQVGSRNCLLYSSGRLVAAVGLQDVVVVETDDAVLVSHKDASQQVKQLVEELKASDLALTEAPRKVHRPWGWYDCLDQGERFLVKRIVVKPGATLSLQMHHHRAEHWVVVRGTAEVTRGEETFLLGENESTFIPVGQVHRLANPGKLPLEIIEVQSGSYLHEDDIVRFEDTYGRTSAQVL
ncbi:mannose-1-phosphate guanylyltransferase/mannose-6-phosphate isomerase [Comamonas serinivorans]|uniref:mannose-1-phosphate guanylyltransferase n=1 Tax=Comamonas serinivorans TaxID=1082851 RepID=A0A1Y0EJV9_9BURK|nr:mannose-1-phosphate guanylyltransferase/mannose-6-phosphate isomerase [Comamonas serinivorans]ARU03649.1 mannose-1-phosphate guanylyltransferase/mannose-6-phosphate isomerase [Comamonas serinivorans]